MKNKYPLKLNDRIYLIDGYDMGLTERTGTYVIQEEKLTIVETGPSPSVKHLKEGLQELGFSLDEVKYIIVTHIHLDHAGGAGLLLQECPNAKVVVHPKGARHLAEPERLIAGARAVYGSEFDDLFDPIVAIPEERLLTRAEGETLQIGENCTLTFFDTPGHANHHFGIYDPVSNGMFTGDTVGVRYEQLAKDGVDLVLPSTSPNQFNPEAMQKAIERFQNMKLSYIYYGHFGMTADVEAGLAQVSEWLPLFLKTAKDVKREQKDHEELAKRLQALVKDHLRGQEIPDDHEVYQIIQIDTEVGAMGLLDYLEKQH
ncbi:MBL fold metallo-hydrolase [Psychrobacillus sp. Sa2BUA9]|uniref:MBL fold metallo-hydrolase n=1 Tax=Psychrobacillus faecigallinarum TaxID=2762235 RepID=A0ABR8R9G4_9BACI|nr:MBL fold metallo-hydrolase [Psychrobacillus faecigallinarum]MBD7944277.1 MBL fold metallo-hydrolase [Psychrobacillus faecigallinarum]